LKRHPTAPGDAKRFDWHFIVPCCDEALVIEDTVLHLVDRFPNAQVWCVDDASHDASPYILDRSERDVARVHVVRRANRMPA
jgi:glycosyltransferase involved in cell wall biosynthesis